MTNRFTQYLIRYCRRGLKLLSYLESESLQLLLIIFQTLLLAAMALVILWRVRRWFKGLNRRVSRLEATIWESHALIQVLQGRPAPPRPGGWAASTDVLVEVLRLVTADRPALIVEFGSGLSTVLMAAALKRNGSGKIISVDHDPDYAAATRRDLELYGLQAHAEVRVVPLKDQLIGGETRPWYDMAALQDLRAVDLAFVDGPPAQIREDIRWPSLPFLWDRLSHSGKVVMDDAARPEERRMIEAWKSVYADATFASIAAEKGAVIIAKSRRE